ncbi:MAG TPA: ion transport 2 domain protein, partial [Gammaproteobacteria bacterium]|nr:ion transport 2 domain protein [Gammaproteobacteria bacterium]
FVYFSITNYTTDGHGDIKPFGHFRFTAGIEAITGLLLITWSASFMFVEMTKFWEEE